ncbi:MAG: hypothetical protein RSD91_07285 [Clostridiales bacterium]
MKITELLLNKDKSSLKRDVKTKTIYSPSLSQMLDEDVEITIKEIENERFFEFNQRLNDEEDAYTMSEFACDMCLAAIVDPDFHDAEIYERFAGAHTPEDAIKVAFTAIEQMSITNTLSEMQKVSPKKEDIKSVKN